jgi:hypothetical protein
MQAMEGDLPLKIAAHIAVHCLTRDAAAVRLQEVLSAAGYSPASLLSALRNEVDSTTELLPDLEDKSHKPARSGESTFPAERILRLINLYGRNKITGIELSETLQDATQAELLQFVMQEIAGWSAPARSRTKTSDQATSLAWIFAGIDWSMNGSFQRRKAAA